MVDKSSNTLTATSHKAKTMKEKRERMKTQEVEEGADKNFDMLTVTFPLSMRSNGEEYKDSSRKTEIEDGSSKTMKENKESAKTEEKDNYLFFRYKKFEINELK